ncbi:hypothetical protein ROHU_023771 [Labeo rohita]|uniref:Uncharacterized protein n=1 Tax=Labeo rohita TaxID=84645 RepID=A0A498MZG3_LABRO|nr:hypothetical protein ROHU_023771 [Labeo rohita]
MKRAVSFLESVFKLMLRVEPQAPADQLLGGRDVNLRFLMFEHRRYLWSVIFNGMDGASLDPLSQTDSVLGPDLERLNIRSIGNLGGLPYSRKNEYEASATRYGLVFQRGYPVGGKG